MQFVFFFAIVCALTFYIGYDIYALLTVYTAWYDEKVSTVSFVVKCIIAVICNCCLAGDLTLSKNIDIIPYIHRYNTTVPQWYYIYGKNKESFLLFTV